MPFGLTNAPVAFQRLIDRAIGSDLQPHDFVYLDDVIVVSNNFDEHMKLLETVLDRIHIAGLLLSRKKCHFCKPQLKYLGYLVDKQGLRVDPDKVAAILNDARPTTVSQVRSFLGMPSWYCRFVPHFSSIIAPLTELTKKNRKFIWTERCEEAFSQIKGKLVSSPILTCADFNHPFCLQTDASNYGIGAVLTQTIHGEERVICFLSRSLTAQERRYTTTEKVKNM